MSDLELELTRHLAPVKAPDGLWLRVQEGRMPKARGWVLWPAVAAVLLIGCVDLFWQAGPRINRMPGPPAAAGCAACHVGGL